jgi:hypothetical protein
MGVHSSREVVLPGEPLPSAVAPQPGAAAGSAADDTSRRHAEELFRAACVPAGRPTCGAAGAPRAAPGAAPPLTLTLPGNPKPANTSPQRGHHLPGGLQTRRCRGGGALCGERAASGQGRRGTGAGGGGGSQVAGAGGGRGSAAQVAVQVRSGAAPPRARRAARACTRPPQRPPPPPFYSTRPTRRAPQRPLECQAEEAAVLACHAPADCSPVTDAYVRCAKAVVDTRMHPKLG